jgi:hypothetical protein
MSSYYAKCTQKIFGLNIIIGICKGSPEDREQIVYRPDVSFEQMCLIEKRVWLQLTNTYGYSHKPDKKRHFIIKREEQDTFVSIVDSLFNKICK